MESDINLSMNEASTPLYEKFKSLPVFDDIK